MSGMGATAWTSIPIILSNNFAAGQNGMSWGLLSTIALGTVDLAASLPTCRLYVAAHKLSGPDHLDEVYHSNSCQGYSTSRFPILSLMTYISGIICGIDRATDEF